MRELGGGLAPLRRQGRAERLQIAAIAARFGIEEHLDNRLAAYAERLSPAIWSRSSGDRFPRLVGSGR